MTKSNETSTATFATRSEALAYVGNLRLLADLHPERGLRTCGPWQASWEPGSPYAWAVQVAWGGRPF